MDATTANDLASKVLATVITAVRRVYSGEVDENLDLIAAGFDSLSSMELTTILEQELGVDCTLADIFDTTSLAELADLLVQRINEAGNR
ncbi:acyl carrier protein [Streptomyces sp. NPDC052299]|uniref:acyl carrier protein n=1 Tax=Streptomyces sp. NPDC052299 TaxID=3155054 RepID=UPI0034331FAD